MGMTKDEYLPSLSVAEREIRNRNYKLVYGRTTIEAKDSIARLDISKDKLITIEEHLVRTIPEESFKTLARWRGNYSIGRARSLLNYFSASMELELPTVARMAWLTAEGGFTSKLAHLMGLHAYYTPSSIFWGFGARLLRTPDFTNQVPHLMDYLHFLREEGGLRNVELMLRSKKVYVPRQPLVPIVETWPFIPGEQRGKVADNVAGLDWIEAVDALVPKSLPQQVREDLCQDVIVALLLGEVTIANLPNVMPDLTRKAFRMYPGKYGALSLDQPLGHDGDGNFSLLSVLPHTESIEDSLCWNCEANSDIFSDGLCRACYVEFMNKAEEQRGKEEFFALHPVKRAHKMHVGDRVADMLAQDGRKNETRRNHTRYTRPSEEARG